MMGWKRLIGQVVTTLSCDENSGIITLMSDNGREFRACPRGRGDCVLDSLDCLVGRRIELVESDVSEGETELVIHADGDVRARAHWLRSDPQDAPVAVSFVEITPRCGAEATCVIRRKNGALWCSTHRSYHRPDTVRHDGCPVQAVVSLSKRLLFGRCPKCDNGRIIVLPRPKVTP